MRRAAWRQPARLGAVVLAAVLVGALIKLGISLARDFWILVIAWMQP
ncbi:hypothetical protein [Sphingomonas sp. MS122]